jgi:hypothetical protein
MNNKRFSIGIIIMFLCVGLFGYLIFLNSQTTLVFVGENGEPIQNVFVTDLSDMSDIKYHLSDSNGKVTIYADSSFEINWVNTDNCAKGSEIIQLPKADFIKIYAIN